MNRTELIQAIAEEIAEEMLEHIEKLEPLTNGEVIISLYPDLKYTIQNGRVVTTIGVASSFDLDWWNTPYKGVSE